MKKCLCALIFPMILFIVLSCSQALGGQPPFLMPAVPANRIEKEKGSRLLAGAFVSKEAIRAKRWVNNVASHVRAFSILTRPTYLARFNSSWESFWSSRIICIICLCS